MADYVWARSGVILGALRIAGTDANQVEALPARAIARYLREGLITVKQSSSITTLDATFATDAELAAAIAGLGILQGQPGPEGPPGPAGPAGTTGLTFRGVWSSTTQYAVSDLVTYNGSGYVCKVAPPVGTAPPTAPTTSNTHWELLVLQGAEGPRGTAGPSGGGALGGKINGAVTATQTSIAATLDGEWPTGAVNSHILVGGEVMRVTNIALASGVWTLTVTRGQLGTTATTHKANTVLFARTPFDVPTRADLAAAIAGIPAPRKRMWTFSHKGSLAVGNGPHLLTNDTGVTINLGHMRATVGTAPAGSALHVRLAKNGTSVNTIAIAAGSTSNAEALASVAWAAGQYLSVDIVQIGSTTAGSDLVLNVTEA